MSIIGPASAPVDLARVFSQYLVEFTTRGFLLGCELPEILGFALLLQIGGFSRLVAPIGPGS